VPINNPVVRRLVHVLLCVAALLPSPAASQTAAPATLAGTITDETGARLNQITVIVAEETGAGGARRVETGSSGTFAFHALPSGRYLVQIGGAGFRTLSDRVLLRPADFVTFDAVLERGAAPEAMARPRRSVARALGPAQTTTIDAGLLQFLPFESRRASDAVRLAPGVHPANHSAYGSPGRSANRYTLDAMSLGDPRGEGVWADGSYRWLRDVEVLSHGAGAEHGGYGGVLVHGVLSSGGEHLSGMFETLFTNDALITSNVPAEVVAQNPALREPARDFAFDGSGHVGGALRPERAWFFTGGQFRTERVTPAGFPPASEDYEPGSGPSSPSVSATRGIFKPTFALGPRQHLAASVAIERLHDNAAFAGPRVLPAATLDDSTTSWVFSGQYTRVLSSSSTLDVRYSGLTGRNEQAPHNGDTPGYYDIAQDVYAVNAVDFFDARRTRHELSATWAHLIDSHALKAGAEFERSGARTETGYNGGRTIDAIFGVPYFAYTWEGDRRDSTNVRLTAFFQDAWIPGPRLAITAGARLDRIAGSLARLDGTVFETTSLAPRVGLAWMPGASGTVIRANYGWYVEGAKSSYYDVLDPGVTPVMGVFVDENLRPLGSPTPVSPGTRHDIDPGLRHPRTQQAAGSVEREIAGRMLIRATGIYRRSDRFIEDVLQFENTEFTLRTIADPGPDGLPGTGDETGTTVTGYNQLTDPFRSRLLITNPDDAFQDYRALEVSATRRMNETSGVQASWVFSRTTGNYDTVEALGNTAEYDSPNVDPRFQPLREGALTNGYRHVLKALGTYSGPWQLTAGVAFYYTSGAPFTRTTRVRFNQGREDLFVEPRGSRRLGPENRLDARLERPFSIGPGRLSVVAEGFNLMNRWTITGRTAASGGAFLTPTGVMAPRRFRLGAVYRF
jgi:hypothetical protein